MGAQNPRVHTVLDPPIYKAVEILARANGLSLSQEVRDLVRAALEQIEDAGLDSFAEDRRRTFNPKKALSVAQVRGRLKQ
jgi:plasmid stability protein